MLAALLDEAASLYTTTRLGYRDSMLRVGELLHQYLLESLNAGNLSRETATANACAALDVTRGKVNELVRISQTVKLLGEPGNLSYSALRAFRCYVHRRRGKKLVGPQREVWQVRQGAHSKAKAFYSEAVTGNFTSKQVLARVRVSKRRKPKTKNVDLNLRVAVRLGTSRDAASLILQLVQEAKEPAVVAKLVKDGLPVC